VADHNAPGAVGAGRLPVNSVAGVRQSTALTYLAAARGRPNLTIRPDSEVDRVIFDRRRAIGVRLVRGEEIITAGRIVLAAGAFGSPAILLRSGIGAASDLEPLGIHVLVDLPGVGRNLRDHPRFGLRFAAPRPSSPDEVPGCQVLLTLRSSESVVSHDLQVFPWAISQTDTATSPTGGLMTIHVSVMKPRSVGWVRLRSSDPTAAPLIDPGYFTHPDDMPRMLKAVAVARQLTRTSPLARFALQELTPGPETTDHHDLETALRAGLATYFHPVGTCAMGPSSNPMAVVDSRGNVHGVECLSVVDASVMPSIPAANTNVPTIMLAERCASWLRSLPTGMKPSIHCRTEPLQHALAVESASLRVAAEPERWGENRRTTSLAFEVRKKLMKRTLDNSHADVYFCLSVRRPRLPQRCDARN